MKRLINEKEVRKRGAPVGIRTREPIKMMFSLYGYVDKIQHTVSR